MFCKNCGAPIEPNLNYCKACGASASTQGAGAQQPVQGMPYTNVNAHDTQPIPYVNPARPVAPIPTTAPRVMTPVRRGPSPVLYVVLGAVIALLIAVIVFLVLNGKGGGIGGADNGKTKGTLTLNVDEYESQTESAYYTLYGSASTTGGKASLSINGKVFDTVTKEDEKKYWSTEVELTRGTNTFEIILYDEMGQSKSCEVVIEREISLLYPKGTVLVKSNASGIYIRPTPRISDSFIRLIPSDDYYSEFICQGEESRDSEGYIWCKVKTPYNEIGWVRSDLVRRVY